MRARTRNFPNNETILGFRAPGGFEPVFCEDDLEVWSTVWPGSDSYCQGDGSLSGYETFASTTIATPYVTVVVTLLFGKGLTTSRSSTG